MPRDPSISSQLQPYVCHCGKRYARASGLSRHKRDVHKQPNPKCPTCGQVFSGWENLALHKKLVHDKIRNHACKECGEKFGTAVHLRRHVNGVHKQLRPEKCPDCGQCFKTKEHLQDHIAYLHSTEKPFACPVCLVGFPTKNQLRGHVVRHAPPRLACPHCPKKCTAQPDLTKHILRCHEKMRNYSCPSCPHTSFAKNDILLHVRRVHENVRPFVCTECSSAFATPTERRLHYQRIHTNTKGEYECDTCGKEFLTNGELQAHLFTHSTELNYPCVQCAQRFNNPARLRNHYRRVHLRLKPHKCKDCAKAFFTNGELQYHIRSHHTGERPFACSICKKGFFNKTQRDRHESEVHHGPCTTCIQAGQSPKTANLVHKQFAKEKLCLACGTFLYGDEAAFREEHRMAAYLQDTFASHPDVTDIQLDRIDPEAAGCTRRRPDVVIRTSFGPIIVECDEYQHRSVKYSCTAKEIEQRWDDIQSDLQQEQLLRLCEHSRMSEIATTGEIDRTVFYRFNPHTYKNAAGERIDVPRSHRYETLTRDIKAFLKRKWTPDHFIQIVYLYYDGPVRQEDFVPVDGSEYRQWIIPLQQ